MFTISMGGQAGTPQPMPFAMPEIANTETDPLVSRWIRVFREPPVLIDRELMRRVLDDHERASFAPRRHVRSGEE